jgi:hypothetical protein
MAKKVAAKRTAKTSDAHKLKTRLGPGKRKAPPVRAGLWDADWTENVPKVLPGYDAPEW